MPASVRRAVEALDLFSLDRPDLGPTEVAAALGIAKSSAHGLLAELTRAGLTERLPCGRYQLGWRTVRLARTRMRLAEEVARAAPEAQRLAASTGHTVRIGALDRQDVLYLLTVRPDGGVPTSDEPVPASATPMGSVLARSDARALVHEASPLERDDRVQCIATSLRGPGSSANAAMAICGPRERIESAGEHYRRALDRAARRSAEAVR